jgi:hypothetical protein
MKTIALPRSQALRLTRVCQALEIERRPSGEFSGKRLQVARHLISIPLGPRWRALFVQTDIGYKFRDASATSVTTS